MLWYFMTEVVKVEDNICTRNRSSHVGGIVMAEFFKIEEVKEKVILVGVSFQEGDDTQDSLDELGELAQTAGAELCCISIRFKSFGILTFCRQRICNRKCLHDRKSLREQFL